MARGRGNIFFTMARENRKCKKPLGKAAQQAFLRLREPRYEGEETLPDPFLYFFKKTAIFERVDHGCGCRALSLRDLLFKFNFPKVIHVKGTSVWLYRTMVATI